MTRKIFYPPSGRAKVGMSPPLRHMLTYEANLRGDTLQALAQTLGVTYRRWAQWQSLSDSIANAHADVFTAAAAYLRLPRVTVLACAGVISLEDFERPSHLAKDVRVHRELEAMKSDPSVAPFVPSSLAAAPADIRMFVIFLYKEAKCANAGERSLWLSEVLATVAMAQHHSRTSSEDSNIF